MNHAYRSGLYTRDEVRTMPCPDCGAQPGDRCWTHAGVERESNHQGRLDAFKKAQGASR